MSQEPSAPRRRIPSRLVFAGAIAVAALAGALTLETAGTSAPGSDAWVCNQVQVLAPVVSHIGDGPDRIEPEDDDPTASPAGAVRSATESPAQDRAEPARLQPLDLPIIEAPEAVSSANRVRSAGEGPAGEGSAAEACGLPAVADGPVVTTPSAAPVGAARSGPRPVDPVGPSED